MATKTSTEVMRCWREENPDRVREQTRMSNARKEARRRGVENSLTHSEWMEVLDQYEHRCVYCFGPYEQIDHVVAMRDGGGNTKQNVVPSCRECNQRKTGRKSGWVPSIASPFWPTVAEAVYA